ncbi:MAG: hypothetical protein LZF86_110513 [Nitrospira sp.]|nr:MAG: hypothetical protein LZF86_110513 [Nitrospira sp.]
MTRCHASPNQGGTAKRVKPSPLILSKDVGGGGFFIFRLLKQTANFVLGVNASSTYPAGTPAVHVSPAASVDSLFEQSEIARR